MAKVHCEVNIIRLTNLAVDLPPGKLFIRYYVYAGRGRRIQIDTREISSTCDANWDEQSSLECEVASDPTKEAIREQDVVFELRWRRAKPFFGAKAKSELLGRAEVAWEEASGSGDVSVEKQVSLIAKKPVPEGEKPPTLVVRMGIRVRGLEARGKKRVVHEMGWDGCGCESCCGWVGSEEDMFQAANVASMIDAW